jgi:hypothetical protein
MIFLRGNLTVTTTQEIGQGETPCTLTVNSKFKVNSKVTQALFLRLTVILISSFLLFSINIVLVQSRLQNAPLSVSFLYFTIDVLLLVLLSVNLQILC